ncbi:two component response regulator [Psychroflexus torquis ATCC 700755]|uniref:Two component response regulator n=1 Tax=Psychroflexus torquis (strain ATCC 700755 / CIP 106069 / ACAM 623) TaxID=313595 RepID=K4IHK7_PSYTT|nr:response regulator [Psychroflexus torquis]AFU70002.1 two component response regulator [Psychroflexus torquis ATCC 700755]
MKKILLVDDEPNIIMALEYTLRKNNYNIFIARDGEEAILLSEKLQPDLIILDIMMPKVDGYEVLEYLRQHETLKYTTQTIIISAKQKETDVQKALSLGAKEYIKKPFSMKKLLNTVTDLLTPNQ